MCCSCSLFTHKQFAPKFGTLGNLLSWWKKALYLDNNLCIWIILTRPEIVYYKPVHFELAKSEESGIWNGVNWCVRVLILNFHLFPTGEWSQICVLEITQSQVSSQTQTWKEDFNIFATKHNYDYIWYYIQLSCL